MLKLYLWYFGHLIGRPWCWETSRVGGEGDNRGCDGWMVLWTQWTWVWASSGRWWRTAKPGMLQFMGCRKSDTTERLYHSNADIRLPGRFFQHSGVSVSWSSLFALIVQNTDHVGDRLVGGILGGCVRKGWAGNSLVVQGLELSASTTEAWVQSLVEDLRSCKLRDQKGWTAGTQSECLYPWAQPWTSLCSACTIPCGNHDGCWIFRIGLYTIRAVLGWKCLKISEKMCFGIFWGRGWGRCRMDVHDSGWMRGAQRCSWRRSIKPLGTVMSWGTWTCWASIPLRDLIPVSPELGTQALLI